ncbi:MAG: hypothetical protein IKH13_07265, partial [Clostridia bacterium]|nr:hypothetical protein [Clostridia bacterium]
RDELLSGEFEARDDVHEKTIISQEDKQWVIDNAAYWDTYSMEARNRYNIPLGFDKIAGTGVIPFGGPGFSSDVDHGGFGSGPATTVTNEVMQYFLDVYTK